MLFLLAVVIVALRWGLGPAIFTALASVVAFDFFIVPPRLTFEVPDTQYLLTFVGLLITGIVISTLAARARQRADEAVERAHLLEQAREAEVLRATEKLQTRAPQLHLPRPAHAARLDHRRGQQPPRPGGAARRATTGRADRRHCGGGRPPEPAGRQSARHDAGGGRRAARRRASRRHGGGDRRGARTAGRGRSRAARSRCVSRATCPPCP